MIDLTLFEEIDLAFPAEAQKMPSSNSSLNLSFSTRVLLLLLFIGCFRPSSSAALPTQTNDIWRSPCGSSSADYEADYNTDETITIEWIDEFAQLSRMSSGLKQMVNSLKNDYVNARFVRERYAEEERVDSGLVITGSPSWNASSDSVNETLLTCYENLARLAVLTRLVKEGEETAGANERLGRHLASRFQAIEYHVDAGLYVLMCNLYVVMTSRGIVTMSPETEAEVASIRFEAVSNNAIGDVRVYRVLLALENSADQLSSRFARLAGQVASLPI